jgi:uncharacterized protein (TIGR00369 family)
MAEFTTRELTEGLNGFLGFRLTDWRDGYAEIAVDIADVHKNRQGGVHGGTTAALIDAATGFCGIWERDPEKRRGNVTVSLTVNFVGRPRGTTLTCAARVVKAGRRIYFSAAEVKDDQDNLIATADAIYAYTDVDHQRR